MIRVTHVLWSGGIGGIERLVHDVALAQRDLGLDVRVAFASATGPFADRLRDAGVPVVDLEIRSGYDVRPRTLLRARRALAQADVLHLHAWNLPLALVTTVRPIVDTEHGTLGLTRRRTPAARGRRIVQRIGIARSAVVTAPSSFVTDLLSETLGVPEGRVRVVPNGIAAGGVPTTGSGERRELTVAVVARLATSKRIHRALDAVALVPPEMGVRLLVAGGGPLEAALRERAAASGLSGRVSFLGPVADVHALLLQADVLVLPTAGEPFGLVVLEAAAAGALPIAFADAGGALEILPADGIVVRDERELAATLARLPGSPLLSDDARRRRSEWALATYPIARTAAAYLRLYEEVLA